MARTARQVSADRVSRMLASDRASDAPRRLGELARKTVGRQVARLRKAGRRDLKDLGNLHALRIAAKRLRYAMELFAGCFAAEFRGGLYREVEAVQDELGHVNDLRTLRGMLQARRGAHSLHLRGKGRKQLVRAVRGELVARQSEFVAGWDARRSRLERAFAHMLRPPGAPRRRARRHHQESERIASRSA
jgi:CHAD domain-containing protein